MNRVLVFIAMAACSLDIAVCAIDYAHAQGAPSIASGNMRFDARSADENGDGIISKDEMTRYAERMWLSMAHAAGLAIPVVEAAKDFSRGNLRFDAKAVDADGDGKITRTEFMAYQEARFDATRNASGVVSIVAAAKAFGRGNLPTS
jgi:EF hand